MPIKLFGFSTFYVCWIFDTTQVKIDKKRNKKTFKAFKQQKQ